MTVMQRNSEVCFLGLCVIHSLMCFSQQHLVTPSVLTSFCVCFCASVFHIIVFVHVCVFNIIVCVHVCVFHIIVCVSHHCLWECVIRGLMCGSWQARVFTSSASSLAVPLPHYFIWTHKHLIETTITATTTATTTTITTTSKTTKTTTTKTTKTTTTSSSRQWQHHHHANDNDDDDPGIDDVDW